MGAEFNYKIIEKPNATHAELQQEWKSIVEQCVYENGHDSYSGTLKECAGMQIVNKHFSSGDKAYDWVSENTEKWQEAKMVSYDDIVTETASPLTFNGKELSSWLRSAGLPFQAQCLAIQSPETGRPLDSMGQLTEVSHFMVSSNRGFKTIYADQLTETQTRLLKQAYEKFEEINKTVKPVKKRLTRLASNVGNLDQTFSKEEWKELKKSRETVRKLLPKLEKAKNDFLLRDAKYAEKHIKTKTINKGKKWLVGGWCSS